MAEAEQRYADIYEEYEGAREFYAGVEAAMHKASQEYLKDKRQWKEASEAAARQAEGLQAQLAAERAARDAAEAALAQLQDRAEALEMELQAARGAAAAAAAAREAALAGESAALGQLAAAQQAQQEAEQRAERHAEERERAERDAAKARVDAQRWPAALLRTRVHLLAWPARAHSCRCAGCRVHCRGVRRSTMRGLHPLTLLPPLPNLRAAARPTRPAASSKSWRSGRRR